MRKRNRRNDEEGEQEKQQRGQVKSHCAHGRTEPSLRFISPAKITGTTLPSAVTITSGGF